MEKKQICLEVSGAEELAEGVFRTTLTHPLLDGKLSFLHSTFSGREEMIKALSPTWKDEAVNVVQLLGEVEVVLNKRKERLAKKNENSGTE